MAPRVAPAGRGIPCGIGILHFAVCLRFANAHPESLTVHLDESGRSALFNHMVNSTPTLDRVFHALADPTRRALLTRLARGDATVGELAQPFTTSLPAISKHLKVLEQAGLLSREVRGREHHCRLAPGPLRSAGEWIGYYRRFWNERLDALEELFTGGSIPGRPRTGGRRARHRH